MNSQILDYLKTVKKQIEDGKLTEALQVLESALSRNPEPWLKTEIHFQAALCEYELGKYDEAAENLETALSLSVDMAHTEKKHIYELLRTAYLQTALCKCELEKYAEAVEPLEAALSLSKDIAYAEKKHICDLLRMAYKQKPDHIKLAGICRTLMSTEEDKTGLMSDLLFASRQSGWADVAQVLEEFPDIDLDAASILYKIRCFTGVNRYKEAFQASREYIERFGEDHFICAELMELCFNVFAGRKGFEYYKKAISLCDEPEWRLYVGCRLFVGDSYQGVISDGEFPDVVNDMRRITEKLQVNSTFDNTPKPFRKIKLGYLSADLRIHPVGYFLTPVMSNTMNNHCFNFCFSLAKPKDEDDPVTAQLKSLAHKWDEVYGCTDSHIEQLFLTNRIDIAFDLMCHTDNNRIQLYARRLAPVQISWIGFPVTSGVAAMDYVIADKNTDPPGSEKYYTEKLLYMPDCFLCHTVKSGLDVASPAFTSNGYITFACFHNLQKITDKTLNLWRRILDRCDDSRLKIMGRPYGGEEGREMLNDRIKKSGLQMERVSVLPQCAINDYFASYNDIDIMLDTYPFSGATTTFDALRMGRPIITLVGERHVTRVSYSLLKRVGLEDLAAFSEDEYVEKAVALAGDHERLLEINADLPLRVDNSPLTDQPAFRRNFEKIIRDVWVRYCFENRKGYYDYNADNPSELLEQVINATSYIEKKLDLGNEIDGALAAEYHRAQKAFCNKLSLVTNDEKFVRDYEKLVRMIGRRLDKNDFRLAVSAAKRYLNIICNGKSIDFKKR